MLALSNQTHSTGCLEVKYLLIAVHAGEATGVAGLTALAGNVFDLLLRAVGEVAGVLVVGHFCGEVCEVLCEVCVNCVNLVNRVIAC